MDASIEVLNLNYVRRFGVEIEINSFDGRNRPIGYEDGVLPEGIDYVGSLVNKITHERVVVHKWGNDHHNDMWVVKPDGSCGMEVCTPVLKGWNGINRVCKVIHEFDKDPMIEADHRCSLHVHVDVSDLNDYQIASIVTWWVKCEAVFMDSVPTCRKRNQYCQVLSQTDLFDNVEDGLMANDILLSRVGNCKYYTLNTFHYMNRKRKTIEFRIMDAECCLNAWMTKNWVRLILHFVERAHLKGLPENYKQGNQWTGYCWLDPFDVFRFLGFLPDQCQLSPGIAQVKNWFINRLHNEMYTGLRGVLGNNARKIAHGQIDELFMGLTRENFTVTEDDLYGENYRI